jgi:hypothetical protein
MYVHNVRLKGEEGDVAQMTMGFEKVLHIESHADIIVYCREENNLSVKR